MDAPKELAEIIADGVLGHPAVVRLDGGIVATYLPGRKVAGVRMPEADEPIEISVVLRLGAGLPEVTNELRRLVRGAAGDVPVNVTVTDLDDGEPEPSASDAR